MGYIYSNKIQLGSFIWEHYPCSSPLHTSCLEHCRVHKSYYFQKLFHFDRLIMLTIISFWNFTCVYVCVHVYGLHVCVHVVCVGVVYMVYVYVCMWCVWVWCTCMCMWVWCTCVWCMCVCTYVCVVYLCVCVVYVCMCVYAHVCVGALTCACASREQSSTLSISFSSPSYCFVIRSLIEFRAGLRKDWLAIEPCEPPISALTSPEVTGLYGHT